MLEVEGEIGLPKQLKSEVSLWNGVSFTVKDDSNEYLPD